MMESWNDPASRHAMVVHFPIVLAYVGVAIALAAAIAQRSAALRWVALGCFAVASAGAGVAANAGEDAEHRVKGASPPLTMTEAKALHDHEELGENGWIWPLIPAACVGLSFIRKPKVARVAAWAAVPAAVSVAVWVALTAHAGGELVYKHGLGTPRRVGPYLQQGEQVDPED